MLYIFWLKCRMIQMLSLFRLLLWKPFFPLSVISPLRMPETRPLLAWFLIPWPCLSLCKAVCSSSLHSVLAAFSPYDLAISLSKLLTTPSWFQFLEALLFFTSKLTLSCNMRSLFSFSTFTNHFKKLLLFTLSFLPSLVLYFPVWTMLKEHIFCFGCCGKWLGIISAALYVSGVTWIALGNLWR